MDYRKKYLNRTGFQRAGLATLPYLSRGWSQPGVYKAPRGFTGMQEILAGGALGVGASKFLKDEDKENLLEKVDEDKKKEEPPEDPDLLPEILNLKDINLDEEKDITIETEEDFKKLEEEQQWFPFSKEDFEGGALDNEIFKNTLNIIKGDIEFTGDKSFDEDAFLLTPPRGQQEIALRFLKQKLINDEADSKFIEHISKLQKNLGNLIEKEGYYGDLEAESTGIGKALTEGYGLTKLLKRKKNAIGGLIDKPLTGRSRYI